MLKKIKFLTIALIVAMPLISAKAAVDYIGPSPKAEENKKIDNVPVPAGDNNDDLYMHPVKNELDRIQKFDPKKHEALTKPKISIGQSYLDFKATDTYGKDFSLSQYAGKIIVLEWFNYDCPFVQKHYQTGNSQAIQRRYRDLGVIWVIIDSTASGKNGYFPNNEEANNFLRDYKSYPHHFVRDETGALGKLYGTITTPQYFIIDKKGKINYMGAMDNIPSADGKNISQAVNFVSRALNDIYLNRLIRKRTTTPYGCGVKYSTQ